MQNVIEVLESRIAPAAVFTYTEADGDVVKIKTSAKISNADFEAYIQAHGDFGGGNLVELNLHDRIFQKTDLTFSVSKAAGDGKVSVGYINASVDLKNVAISGDLEAIRVGDSNYATPALSKLQVRNLGGTNDGTSYFNGDVKAVKILEDLTGDLTTEGFNFDSITISGSIKGASNTPEIYASRIGSLVVGKDMQGYIDARTIKSIRIGGDIVGVDWNYGGSGTIQAQTIESIRIGGSIIGGDDNDSAGIQAERIDSVLVGGDITGGKGGASGFIWADERLGKVVVAGSVNGGAGDGSGRIGSYGDIRLLQIGKDVRGGTGNYSGVVGADEGGTIDKIVIRGSIIGGGELRDITDNGQIVGQEVVGNHSGQVRATFVKSLSVGGDLKGGLGSRSGYIYSSGIGSASIGGSLLGGVGESSGSVEAYGIGSIRVAKNVTGGTGKFTGSIVGEAGIDLVKIGGNLSGDAKESGSIGAPNGSIGTITIGGNLSNTGNAITGIYAGGTIGRVSIGGDAIGGEYRTLGIRAANANTDEPSLAETIGSVSIKGNVTNFLIEAGVNRNGSANPGATIGSITIGKNFTSSSIVASLDADDDGFYGTADDTVSPGTPSIVSRIASVVIGGTVSGTPAATNDTDRYGIIAQHIVAVKIGGKKQALTEGASNDTSGIPLAETEDVLLLELPASQIPRPA